LRLKRRREMAKYQIVRKAGIFAAKIAAEYKDMELIQPEVTPVKKPDTGPLILWSPKLIPDTCQVIEYGIISGDVAVGNGGPTTFKPQKTYNEGGIYFLFLGTNPDNLDDLGAEAEFWLGEDETLEKVVINTPSCVYIPSGTGRFPLIWKNVKRPCIFVVFVPNFTADSRAEPVSLEGRPMPRPN
jgi:hypothetical protein